VSAGNLSLIDPEETGTHAQMNQDDIDRLASGGGSRGLESVLISLPGFAKNANGAIHPRGAHNQMTFVIDGMPISDQLTGGFANAMDPSVAQTVELFTGNISAEYGARWGPWQTSRPFRDQEAAGALAATHSSTPRSSVR